MNRSEKPKMTPMARMQLLLAVSLLLVLAACQSTPPPPAQQMQAAQFAIASAEQERAADFVPLDMRQAHDKLTAARVAIQAEDMELAARLADESRVSAELATARTAQMKARAMHDEMQQSLNTLQREILRNTGPSQ